MAASRHMRLVCISKRNHSSEYSEWGLRHVLGEAGQFGARKEMAKGGETKELLSSY